MKQFYTKLFLTLFFIATTLELVAQVDIPVSQDLHIDELDPNDNYDGEDYLRVRISSIDNQRAYLKFDLSSLTSNIISANLHYFARRTDVAKSIAFHEFADDSWTESDTFNTFGASNNFGTFGSQIGTDVNIDSSTYDERTLDVTAYAQAEYAGDQIMTIVIQIAPSESGNRFIRIGALDPLVNPTGAQPAFLRVTTVTLSNEEFNTISFKMFPNPSNEKLNINTKVDLASVTIFSITGKRLIYMNNINSKNVELDIAELNSGLYLVKAMSIDNGFAIKKLIKN